MGTPSEGILIWGDGNIETIQPSELNEENGVLYGSLIHNYSIQGKFFPKLHIWDYNGRLKSKTVSLTIQNDPLQFTINLSCGTQAFEDQEVEVKIEDLFENEGLEQSFENFTYLYDFSDAQITSKERSITYSWKNSGIYPLTVYIIDGQGTISRRATIIEVINPKPYAFYEILSTTALHAQSKIHFTARKSSDTISDKNSLQYIWDMGDNTTAWGKHVYHVYLKAGLYYITLIVIDDDAFTHNYSRAIWVNEAEIDQTPPDSSNSENHDPYIAIGTFPEELYEDELFQFTPIVDYQVEDVFEYDYEWDFGNGVVSFEQSPKLSWARAGVYNITLKVLDTNENEFLRHREITIKEKAPEVLGPFSFQGIEGQAIILDVEVYDALLDFPNLRYYWYNERGELFSTQKMPNVILNDGNYTYTLNVTDSSGFTSSREIHIIVFSFSPEVYVPNYMYYGPSGELTLRAYGYDCIFDNSELDFRWSITSGKDKEFLPDNVYNNYCEITFRCEDTTIYQGQVEVTDPSGKVRVTTFEIFSQVDLPSQEDKYSDFNKMYGLKSSQAQDSGEDSDGDNLTDYYENEISFTNYLVKDTDGDGLVDGYNDLGIGELTLGTSPIDSDSDNDQMNDGLEYYGYEISINYFENSSILQTSSDPLNNDTDNDTISDYEEYLARSHPRLLDSDADGLFDYEDPYPTNWDFDGDFLSDFMEKSFGTLINASDTDEDGLQDGEEVNGFGLLQFQTNPTCSDTDRDFVFDNAEIMNYNIKLTDDYGKEVRVNVSEPISLHFPNFFTKAVTAQIAFTLSFGEQGSENNQTYGILEQEVLNLTVRITKSDDDIVLYESTTNSTRHFSQVVDITKIMNNETLALNYYGDYVLEVTEVGGETIPGCLLEQFELDFCRYLDPNCDDFDGDGILDGVEMDTLVRGTEIIDIRDYYNCTSDGSKVEDINEIYLEIPQTGRVFDAELFLSINSGKHLLGSGNITLEIIKKNTNINIPDLTVLSHFEEFDIDDIFAYERAIDLSDFIDSNKMKDYYGEYFLKVVIHDTNLNDTFFIFNYHIETDTYIQARPQDTQAWITDPALSDSDGDNWSDSYEIFTSKTNPLNRDTDGDSTWDSNDRDPLRNVMLEIRPISGKFKNQYFPWPTPTLQIIVKLHVNDIIDSDFSEESSKIGFCTTAQKATTDPTWWGAYQTAWWIYGERHRYYIDISDDITIQSNTIPIYFQLWQMLSTGDVDIFAGSWLLDTYSINEVGHQQELFVSKNGDNVRCEVETIAIERANTIAIYNPNATVFNGHYQDQERMNIIQLHITEDGHYPASLSFDRDITGETPEDWQDSSDSGQNPIIIDELDGHNKVLQFHDTSSSNQGRLVHNWEGSYMRATIEVWVRLSSTTERALFIIRDGSDSNSIFFRFDSSGYMQYRVASEYIDIDPYNANEWYHLKFQWDCYDEWHLWINGICQDTMVDITNRLRKGFEFYGSPTEMDGVVIETTDNSEDLYYYIDSIGYSFDPYYSIGDNLERSDCAGTPFKPGPNIITIPTSIFDKTLLNAHIQTGHLEDTPLYTEQKGLFEFYSIDRDGSIDDSQCGDTDFLFIRYDISPNDALEILNLLLICALNQSLDEYNNTITKMAQAYRYSSTKINGTDAVSMNLPQGLLFFIPWISDHQNSPYGNTPETFNFLGILLAGVLGFLFPTVGLVMVTTLAASLIASFFAEVAKAIGLVILTFLAKLVWILIRIAIIILFYILLAIEILTTSLLIAPLGFALLGLGGLMGITSRWGLNWCVKYGENTRIGNINVEMNETTILIESWINWVYWEFFDLYIPLPDLDIEINSTFNKPVENPEPPTLHCGYNQIGNETSTEFNFFTTYQDCNANEPRFVNLCLINPNCSEIFYNMTATTLISDENLVSTGIEYNLTIDFKNKASGQWFYYFKSQEESSAEFNVKWPYEYYCEPGPFISDDGSPEDTYSYFLYSDVDKYSGFESTIFNFTVLGVDFLNNKIPENVKLNILWENGSIQPFIMDIIDSFSFNSFSDPRPKVVNYTTYSKAINFSNYININKTYIVRSFYSAEFFDGNFSILFDYHENKTFNLEFDLLAKQWFSKPILVPHSSEGNPQILGWRVETIRGDREYDSTSSSTNPIGPIIDEEILRFWVFISDPDGDHIFHRDRLSFVFSPKLILKNCDSSTPIEEIEMVWAGKGYDPFSSFDAYFIDVSPFGAYTHNYENYTYCDFGPGAWTFNFSVTDHTNNEVSQKGMNRGRSKKIWLIGSLNNIWDTAFNGYDFSGNHIDKLIPGAGMFVSTGIMISFFATALLSMMGDTGRVASRYLSIGILAYDIINSFIGIGILLNSRNTGSLIGMCLSAIISTIGASFAHSLGGITNLGIRKLDLRNINLMAKVAKYAYLINIILALICNPTILFKANLYGLIIIPGSGDEFDWDLPGEDMIRRAPMIITTFLISVLSLGAVLNLAEMKQRACFGFIGTEAVVFSPVMKVTRYYAIFKILIAVLCLTSFMIKTGMIYVIGDYLINPGSMIFGG